MYLADTDLVSEPRQKRPNPKVLQWLRDHDHELFLSAITIGEIKKGVVLYPDGRKKEELTVWLRGLLEDFDESVVPFTLAEALVWEALRQGANGGAQTAGAGQPERRDCIPPWLYVGDAERSRLLGFGCQNF